VTGSRLESLLAILGSREVADFEGEVVIDAAGAARRTDEGMVVEAGCKQSVSRVNGRR
jgi:hypothetical protein